MYKRDEILKYLRYEVILRGRLLVSVVCALISGFTSYAVARRQSKEDVKKLEKTYELDLENEKEKHKLEIDKLELEHKHQLELQQKQFENQLGSDMMNTLISEAMKMPEVKKQISQGMNIAGNKKR